MNSVCQCGSFDENVIGDVTLFGKGTDYLEKVFTFLPCESFTGIKLIPVFNFVKHTVN